MTIEPGIYRHYKGGLYDVIGLATDAEWGGDDNRGYEWASDWVVYRSLDDGRLWFREPCVFTGPVYVVREGGPHEEHASRFARIDDVPLTAADVSDAFGVPEKCIRAWGHPGADRRAKELVAGTLTFSGLLAFLGSQGWSWKDEWERGVRSRLAETAAKKKGATSS